jgi:hypothetical protein
MQPNGQDMSLPNGYVTYNVMGQLCQFVDGNLLPVKITPAGPQMYLHPVNYPFPVLEAAIPDYVNYYSGDVSTMPMYPHPVSRAMETQSGIPNPAPAQSVLANPTTASVPSAHSNVQPPVPFRQSPSADEPSSHCDIDIRMTQLNQDYERVRHEKIEYERDEIRFGASITAHGRATIVQRKKDFVIELDKIRKDIKELKEAKANGSKFVETIQPMASRPALLPTAAPFNPHHATGFGIPKPLNLAKSTSPSVILSDGIIYPGVDGDYANENKTQNSSNGPSPPSRGTRRSHAIEIKDPRSVVTDTASKSALDPTSPSYEPAKPVGHKTEVPPFVPPSPSPIASPKADAAIQAQYPWVFKAENEIEDGNAQARDSRHRASFSSVTTTDLFPHDAEEHSLTKYKQKVNRDSAGSNVSATPTLMTPPKDQAHQSRDHSLDDASPEFYGGKPLRAPPVSPADFRASSFLREVNPSPEEVSDALAALIPLPPSISTLMGSIPSNNMSSLACSGFPTTITGGVRYFDPYLMTDIEQPNVTRAMPTRRSPPRFDINPETRLQFNGKSEDYLRGYIFGIYNFHTSEHESKDFIQGYCAGLLASAEERSNKNAKSAERSQRTSDASLKTVPANDEAYHAMMNTQMNRAAVAVNMAHHPSQGTAVPQHLENARAFSVSTMNLMDPHFQLPAPYGNTQRTIQRRPVGYQHVPPNGMYNNFAPRFPGDGPLARSFSDGLYAQPMNASATFRDDSGLGNSYSAPAPGGPFLTGYSGNQIEYDPRGNSAVLSRAWVSQQQIQAYQSQNKGPMSS